MYRSPPKTVKNAVPGSPRKGGHSAARQNQATPKSLGTCTTNVQNAYCSVYLEKTQVASTEPFDPGGLEDTNLPAEHSKGE